MLGGGMPVVSDDCVGWDTALLGRDNCIGWGAALLGLTTLAALQPSCDVPALLAQKPDHCLACSRAVLPACCLPPARLERPQAPAWTRSRAWHGS